MVICTDANKINAPVPALKLMYAKEKVTAYRKSIAAEIQLPPDFPKDLFFRKTAISHSVIAPVISLIAV